MDKNDWTDLYGRLMDEREKAQDRINDAAWAYYMVLRNDVIAPFCGRFGLRFYAGNGTWCFEHVATGTAIDIDHADGWPVEAWPEGIDEDAETYEPEGWTEAASVVYDLLRPDSLADSTVSIGACCDDV